MLATDLPDCHVSMSGAWHWTDPQSGRPAMRGDRGSWESGQLIAPPVNASMHPEWLARLTAWRKACRKTRTRWNSNQHRTAFSFPLHVCSTSLFSAVRHPVDLDESDAIFEMEEMRWVRGAYVQVQMHPYDLYFFSHTAGEYTVQHWLDDLRRRFGGIDAALIWPTYPQLGIDDRNAYEMIRSLPGGLDGVRSIVRQLQDANVSVLCRGSDLHAFSALLECVHSVWYRCSGCLIWDTRFLALSLSRISTFNLALGTLAAHDLGHQHGL